MVHGSPLTHQPITSSTITGNGTIREWRKIIAPGQELGRASGRIKSIERLGGMLRYYYREAA